MSPSQHRILLALATAFLCLSSVASATTPTPSPMPTPWVGCETVTLRSGRNDFLVQSPPAGISASTVYLHTRSLGAQTTSVAVDVNGTLLAYVGLPLGIDPPISDNTAVTITTSNRASVTIDSSCGDPTTPTPGLTPSPSPTPIATPQPIDWCDQFTLSNGQTLLVFENVPTSGVASSVFYNYLNAQGAGVSTVEAFNPGDGTWTVYDGFFISTFSITDGRLLRVTASNPGDYLADQACLTPPTATPTPTSGPTFTPTPTSTPVFGTRVNLCEPITILGGTNIFEVLDFPEGITTGQLFTEMQGVGGPNVQMEFLAANGWTTVFAFSARVLRYGDKLQVNALADVTLDLSFDCADQASTVVEAGWNGFVQRGDTSSSPGAEMASALVSRLSQDAGLTVGMLVDLQDGRWEVYTPGMMTTDFGLTMGQGAFFYSLDDGRYLSPFTPVGANPAVTLRPGWSLIGVPVGDEAYDTASEVCAALENAGTGPVVIGKWEQGSWRVYSCGLGLPDFGFRPDEPLLVYTTSGGTWVR